MLTLGIDHKIQTSRIVSCKNDVVALQLAIDKAAIKEKELEANARSITKEFSESLRLANDKIQLEQNKVKERIKNDKESRGIKLSPAIVSLFNDSKPTLKLKDPAITKQGDVSGTSAVEEDPPNAYEHTLNELLDISNENDANHVKCIAQVKEWQGFWETYRKGYEAVSNAP
jgi:hypothetical protein